MQAYANRKWSVYTDHHSYLVPETENNLEREIIVFSPVLCQKTEGGQIHPDFAAVPLTP